MEIVRSCTPTNRQSTETMTSASLAEFFFRGQLSKRVRGGIAILIFVIVYASLSLSPDEAIGKIEQELTISSLRRPSRFLSGLELEEAEAANIDQEKRASNLGIDTLDSPRHAIMLMSFGEAAAKSTLLERCVTSIRRRGAFQGKVVVLTDAPSEQNQDKFDKNVIILNTKEEDMKMVFFKSGAHYIKFNDFHLFDK